MGYDTPPSPSTITTSNTGSTNTTNTANSTNSTNTRPQMPSLSASAAARGINRTPLTPKIASVSRPSQPHTPGHVAASTTAVATTPLPRRTSQRRPTSAASFTTSAPTATTPANGGSNRTSYDDPDVLSAAAFSPYLSANVTPRSGSRQNRVDSANSTPNGTPSHDRPDRPDSWESKSGFPFSGSSSQGDSARRPVVTFSGVSPEQNATNSRNSKFFHASDAKTSRPTSASKMASARDSTFFYANGNGITPKSPNSATLSPPLSPSLSQGPENMSSKFMYANGTPEVRPAPPPPITSRASGSAGSKSALKGPTVRSNATLQRPLSPSRPPLHSSSSYRNSTSPKSATTDTSAANIRAPVSPPPLGASTHGLRRPGTATPRSAGHSRSGSLAKVDGVSESLKPMASPTTGLFPPANLSPTVTPPLTLASIIQAAEDFTEHENEASLDDPSGVQSPTKSTASATDPVTELIANARRERKVQDLQIRNASLEAINRTIERQLRKQTAELRRYRRLSRAGHLSLASTTASSRVPSGAVSEPESESLGLTDLSEEEDELSVAGIDDESLSDSDSPSSGLSPSDLAEQDEKHRQRDEERLKLDLSKHQQILVDSQKINQSIKRCLDWSEELIENGRKALQYKVTISDVRLGGRVLDPLDEDEETSRARPSDDNMVVMDAQYPQEVSESSASWSIEPQDRDSGIELSKDGG